MPTTIPSLIGFAKTPWNRGPLIGQRRPLKPKEVWAIRVRLQTEPAPRPRSAQFGDRQQIARCDLVQVRVK
jgi:hypothetical protein